MAMSPTEKMLLAGLKCYQISKGNAILVSMMMETEVQQVEMLKYLLDNEKATEQEILAQAEMIAAK